MLPPPSPERAEQRRGQRLLFVTLLFFLLLNYPLLSLCDHDGRLFGIPVLYLYVLLTWAGIVALTGWLVKSVKS